MWELAYMLQRGEEREGERVKEEEINEIIIKLGHSMMMPGFLQQFQI